MVLPWIIRFVTIEMSKIEDFCSAMSSDVGHQPEEVVLLLRRREGLPHLRHRLQKILRQGDWKQNGLE